MPVTERRTQIYLTRQQHDAVLMVAERRGTSMAHVLRDALDAYLATTPAAHVADDPLADLIGAFEGPGDLARNHDEYLYPKRPRRRARRSKR